MEAGKISIFSATYHTRLLNSSEITTNPTVGKETFKWTDAEIARLIQIIIRPILVIFGTMGNVLTVYIMRATSLKKVSSCFYMFLLALADSRKWTLYQLISVLKHLLLMEYLDRFLCNANSCYPGQKILKDCWILKVKYP